MNKFIAIGILLTAVFSAYCKQKSYTTSLKEISIKYVDPDKKEKLSTIVSAIKYIKLETRPDFLLGDIVHAKMLDKLYCLNSNKINVFDLNGKALFEINHYKSREPGGYMQINDFQIDTITHIIEMWDWSWKKINRYDFNNGKFISSQKFEAQMFTRFIRDSDWNYYFYADYAPNKIYSKEDEIYQLYKFDKDGKFLKKFLKEKYSNKHLSGGGFNILNTYKGNIYFNPLANDFVYTIKNDSLLKMYQFNFGKHSLKDDYFKEYKYWGVTELGKTEFAYSFGGFREYNFGWYFNYNYGKYPQRIFICFLSKRTGKLIVSNGFENDFLGSFISPSYLTSPGFIQDDEFISTTEARSLMKIFYELKNKLSSTQWEQYKIDHSNFCTVCEKLTEMDNPVIVVMTPKEF